MQFDQCKFMSSGMQEQHRYSYLLMPHAHASLHALRHVDGRPGDNICLEEIGNAACKRLWPRSDFACPLSKGLHCAADASLCQNKSLCNK
jgi:hypothetical protein